MSRRFWAALVSVIRSGRAEGGEVVPLSDLMDGPEQVGDDTLAMVAEDPAAKAAAKFTRAGWIEYAPGYWVREQPEDVDIADMQLSADALAMAGSVLADIDDLATYEEAE